jgi:catechol 2,3-dioxygenase-like lactoylglutathione lyase family enzyme
MRIDAIDHLVLTVRDLRAATAFYTRVLGMEEVTFGDGRRALAFGTQKINLHEAGREYEPKAAVPTPGSADLCFVTAASPGAVLAHLHACGVQVVDGPVTRTGARGPIVSVYCRDPDGNLLEVSSYTSGA